jgi:hypothetical protein
VTKNRHNASNNHSEDYVKTWTKSTLSIVIAVAICYGIWFNLLDSIAYCQQSDNNNNQFSHTCTSIGAIFGGNQLYQPWNIIGHFLPGLFMALLFKEKKLELFVAGALISTVVMDSPLWGVERRFFHGLPLWQGVDRPDGNHIHVIAWRIGDWIIYYYNPIGFYSVWDHDWLFPHFPNAATIFWSIAGRIAAAVLLIWYQHKVESNNKYFSLKKLLVRK